MRFVFLPFKKWAQTITSDNGKEFALHEQIAAKLPDSQIWVAIPNLRRVK